MNTKQIQINVLAELLSKLSLIRVVVRLYVFSFNMVRSKSEMHLLQVIALVVCAPW
ncbi:hypothetical protein D3C78_1833080 [compost metagenome]